MASPPFKVKALYEYTSQHDDDLKFPAGAIIDVTEEEGDDWLVGHYTDTAGVRQDGIFPKNFVEKFEPEIPARPVRASRPKSQIQSPPPVDDDEPNTEDHPEQSKPLPTATVQTQTVSTTQEKSRAVSGDEVRSPTTSKPPPELSLAETEPPNTAAKAAQAQPTVQSASSKAAPPPVAPKTNAFKDRIAAFNRTEQVPLAPLQPGRQGPRNDFIKKPFVAPPPSKSAYIPPVQKQEPVQKPYNREEDPEIQTRQEQDLKAAEAAGLTGSSQAPESQEQDEDAPKPMSLRERMALLQEQQRKQAERNAEVAQRKDKRAPVKKPSASADTRDSVEAEGLKTAADVHEEPSEPSITESTAERAPAPAPVPLLPSREPTSPTPAVPAHEILSGGEEADQSAAGETTEDDAETIGPDDEDVGLPRTASMSSQTRRTQEEANALEDANDKQEETEEEEELDEEEQRKQRLRERMARLAGGPPGAAGGMAFNPFGAPMPPAPGKKRSTKPDSESAAQGPPVHQMVPMPGMGGLPLQRVQSPESDATEREPSADSRSHQQHGVDHDQEVDEPRSTRSMTDNQAGAPPVPRGKLAETPD